VGQLEYDVFGRDFGQRRPDQVRKRRLTLAGANTYAGSTFINGGTLSLANALAVPNSTVNVGSSGALSFAASNTNPILGGLAGIGNVTLATSKFEPVTLNVGQNGQSTTYNGTLSGGGGLTKTGTGILTVANAVSYTGRTLLTGGTLAMNAPPLPGFTKAW